MKAKAEALGEKKKRLAFSVITHCHFNVKISLQVLWASPRLGGWGGFLQATTTALRPWSNTTSMAAETTLRNTVESSFFLNLLSSWSYNQLDLNDWNTDSLVESELALQLSRDRFAATCFNSDWVRESMPICLEFSTLKSFDNFRNVSSLNALLQWRQVD